MTGWNPIGEFFVTRAKRDMDARRLYSAPADRDIGKTLVFLTNHSSLPPLTICSLYKARRHVELFFQRIKQHLRIQRFFGTTP